MAIETRKHFRLGFGPISNLTLLLENHGITIAFKKLNKKLSGLSQWINGRPFIIVEPFKSTSRTRFSLAHELGHVILHQQLASESEIMDKKLHKLIEGQANYFGSSFMLPESTLSNEVYGVDWDSLVDLKARWKMSIGAFAMRMYDVGILSEWQKTRIFREIGARNARINEPLDEAIKQDYPRMIRKAAELLHSEDVLLMSAIPETIPINVELISELTQIPVQELMDKPCMDNVISIRLHH